MATQEQVTAAQKELGTFLEANLDRMGYLWSRWMDEREYEDFATYAAEYKKLAETNANLAFKKATKSPMGFVATYKPLGKDIQFYANGSKYGWKPAK